MSHDNEHLLACCCLLYIYFNFCDLGAILYDNQEVKKNCLTGDFSVVCGWIFMQHTRAVSLKKYLSNDVLHIFVAYTVI